jgi:phospholipid/cholesterol/gamma-HCH transport system ATP-binding protein
VTPSDSTILRFEDVSLHFDNTVALDHVSFEMHPGQTFVVFGSAGSGKTMLLKVAVGLVRPDSGRVSLFGQEITQLRE